MNRGAAVSFRASSDELRVPYELLVVVQVGPCAAGPSVPAVVVADDPPARGVELVDGLVESAAVPPQTMQQDDGAPERFRGVDASIELRPVKGADHIFLADHVLLNVVRCVEHGFDLLVIPNHPILARPQKERPPFPSSSSFPSLGSFPLE